MFIFSEPEPVYRFEITETATMTPVSDYESSGEFSTAYTAKNNLFPSQVRLFT